MRSAPCPGSPLPPAHSLARLGAAGHGARPRPGPGSSLRGAPARPPARSWPSAPRRRGPGVPARGLARAAPCPYPCPGAAWRPYAARPRPGAALARAAAVPLRGVAPCLWLGPGVCAIRSWRVSVALRVRVLTWCAQCFGAARRALGATRSVLSRVTCSSTPRRDRLPPATHVFYAR
jgi:hypothetical protein